MTSIRLQFRGVREALVDQQMGDFLEGGAAREIGDVVAAVMKIVAGVADGADRGIAGGHAGKGDGFFGAKVGRRGGR